MLKRVHFEDEAAPCKTESARIERNLRYPVSESLPPGSEQCEDNRLLSAINDRSLQIGHVEPTEHAPRRQQSLQRLIKAGKNPFLYPVPDEAGDYIHVYWTNTLRDQLYATRQLIEENLQNNWALYQPDNPRSIPQAVFQTHIRYVIEPAYNELNSFFCNEDYRHLRLSEELLRELVTEALRGNIVKRDSINYIIRVLQNNPLASIAKLFSNYVEREQPSSNSSRLVLWIKDNVKKGRMTMSAASSATFISPTYFQRDVQKLFLIKLLLRRLYPQVHTESYTQEIRSMLLGENYTAGRVKKLLSSRLRDESYYNKLLVEMSSKLSAVTDPARNVQLFVQDVQTFTMPFKYDTDSVQQAKEFKDVTGRPLYLVVEEKVNSIIHPLLTNVFIPPPPLTTSQIQQLQQSEQVLLRKLSGSYNRKIVETQMSSFHKRAGIAPVFTVSRAEKEVISVRKTKPCEQPTAVTGKRRRKTVEAITYVQLLLLFVEAVNNLNKDDLRRLFAEAYPSLIEQPLLLSYTIAYGPRVTASMVNGVLRRQIESQLRTVWDSIQAKLVVHERLTPVYTMLSLMLHPLFRTFLTPSQQELAQQSWEAFEAAAHKFSTSTDSCTPKQPITENSRIRCVLMNSVILMRLPPQKLRAYHGKDLAKGP